MQKTPFETILCQKPDIPSLRSEGYTLTDMHLHTRHSDGLTKIPDLLKYAKKMQISIAITDHNEISGVLKAYELLKEQPKSAREDLIIIPGTELETKEGPHLLMYFYTTGDLESYFEDFKKERRKLSRTMTKNLPVIDCLTLAENYDCLRVAAHPFGYYGIDRGVLKCVKNGKLPGVMEHLDGIEAICGGMMRGLNNKSILYAKNHNIPFTGGSDAHVTGSIGDVLTGTFAGSVEEHLNAVKKRENIVIGHSGNPAYKGATAGVIAWSFVPFTKTFLTAHCKAGKENIRSAAGRIRHSPKK